MKKLRKFLVVSVMVLSVIAMSGLTFNPVNAAAQAGDLIKMDGLSSVYYLGNDGKRYVFPSEAVYFSWYNDFSSVVTIPASELQSYPLGSNVTMRPGTKLVKITTDPKVYAVGPNGTLHWLQSEADAIALYGASWASKVVDVADAFFTNYTISTPLASGTYPAGTLLKNANNASIYYFDGSNYRMVASESAFVANRFNYDNVVTTTMTLTASGNAITGMEDLSKPSGATTGHVVTGSGLTLSLASDTPAAKTVPSNATGVVMAKYNLTAANDGAITLNSLTLKRNGVGSPSEFSKVYLYDGATRLTNGRTVSSSDNTATFNNIGWMIAAGTTKTLSVVVDVADLISAGNHSFSIESASAVGASSATVTGAFPMTGNIMSFNTTDVGLVDVEGNNTYTVKAGETNVELGRFTVYVNNTEDAQMTGITLYNGNRDVLSNLKLYRGSDLVATGVKNGSYFTFTLDTPYDITKGESVAFTVLGDITGARDGDDATLTVRYNTDVKVMGKTYGYNLKPAISVNGGSSMIEELGGTQKQDIDVEAGQVTLTFNGPVTSNIAKNSNDVVLMDFSITAQSAVDVEKVGIIVKDSDGSDDDDLSNAEIVCGNVIMNEWASFVDATSTPLIDTSVWTINAGETKNCQIRVDVENTKDTDTVSADLDVSNWIFKDADTGDNITDIIPSADLVGNNMTVVATSLTVNLASTPAAQTWVKGSMVDVNGYNFVAGDAKDVKVTAISLTGYVDGNDGTFTAGLDESVYVKDLLSTVELYDGTTKVGDTKTVATDGTITFNTLSWTVPAGATKKLTVKGLSSNNAPYGSNDDKVKFAVTSVTAEYDNGTGLTPTITAVDGEADITIYQTITDTGALTAALDADNPTASLIAMGNQGVALTKVKFSATKEPFTIEKLQVKNGGTASSTANYTSVVLEYKNEAGATVNTTGYFSGEEINFSGLTMYVPKDGSAVLTLKANLNTETGGATNGHQVALDLDMDTNFRAVAKNSSTVKTSAGTGDLAGISMYLYETKPSVNFATDTPSGNLAPSANSLLAKIAVTADAGEDVTFENADGNTLKVMISASATATSTGNMVLKDENGDTLSTVSVDYPTDTDVIFDFATKDFVVPAGTTKYLYVYGDTTGFTTEGDLIQLWLDDAGGNIDWGIDGTGSYNHGDIIFKGDKFGGTFVRP
jgi:hypothetical protein